MGYRKCLGCGYTTGITASHPTCPKSGTAINWEVCDCGSGAHPRRCALHPFAFQHHVDDMNAEAIFEEPDYLKGAAAAFGLMWMAEAIRRIDAIRGCSTCGKASNARVWPTLGRPGGGILGAGWQCHDCARPDRGIER